MSDFENTARAYLRALLRRMSPVDFNRASLVFGYESVFDAFVGASFEVKDTDVVDATRALGKAMQLTEDIPFDGVGRIPFITKSVERTWSLKTAITGIFYNPERVDGDLAELVFGVLRRKFSVEDSEPLVLANAKMCDGLLQITLAPKDGHCLPDLEWFEETLSSIYIDEFEFKAPKIRHQGNSVTICWKFATEE